MSLRLNRFTLMGAIAGIVATTTLTVPSVLAQSRKIISVDGSSTVFPVTEAVAEEFQKTDKNFKVTVGISGTGGGFKKFCRGETDISNASRPIKEKESKLCQEAGIDYIALPVAYDALSVVVHPQNTWAKNMTVAELKKMWSPESQGKITNWNQIRPSFPNAKLVLYGPGTDSGTFDYFTKKINGKEGSSRSDFTASEDDNVLVQGVSSDKNAIGYFGYAYYEANKTRLNSVAIDGGKGPVKPSRQAIESGTYKPLGRPIFIYVNKKAANDRPYLKRFVNFYLQQAPTLVPEVGYVPLPGKGYDLGKANFQKEVVGHQAAAEIVDALKQKAQ